MGLFNYPRKRGSEKSKAGGKARQKDASSTNKETAGKIDSIVSLPEVKNSRQIQLLESASDLAVKIQKSWDSQEPAELAEKIVALENRVNLLEGDSPEVEKIRAVAKDLHFQFVFPLVLELSDEPLSDEFEGEGPYSFARTIHSIAESIWKSQDLSLIKQLNTTQCSEVMRLGAKGASMSPEVLSYAMKEYVETLKHQVEIAKCFFFGKLVQGMEGLLSLPEDVRIQVDQMIWDAAGGVPIDPTEEDSQALIAASIMQSVHQRMGLDEEVEGYSF